MNIIKTNLRFNRQPSMRTSTKQIILHHTDSHDVPASEIHRWHLNRNWLGIGYHFVIRANGRIEEGRPIGSIGSHALGANADSIGIVFTGRFEQHRPTIGQIQAGIQLIKYIESIYGNLEISGHKDHSSTSCPGKFFPMQEILDGLRKEPITLDSYVTFRELYNILGRQMPIEDIKRPPQVTSEPQYTYKVVATTHILEVNPLDLKLVYGPVRGIDVKEKNYINACFVWWEDHPRNTKPYPTSMLIYDGKIIHNGQPNGYWQGEFTGKGVPTPTFIIYKDGTVIIKDTNDLSSEVNQIHLAVTVVQSNPLIRQQGFVPYVGWGSVAYETNRIAIFYRKSDNKVILTYRPATTIDRLHDTGKNLNVDFGGSLDSGGSANFIAEGKKINATSRWMYAGITI